MPFKSEEQKRFLFANKPKLAKKWLKQYGGRMHGKKKGK